jgi:hypothetical protein
MRFLAPGRERAPQDAAQRAYMSGLDEIPWQTRVTWQEPGLVARRSESDSGNFHFPWLVPGHGEVMLASGSLMERDQPYHLQVELARGTVNRVRNQIAGWQSAGLVLSAAALRCLSDAKHLLSRAATTQHEAEPAALLAEQSIQAALDAIQVIGSEYAVQAVAERQRRGSKVSTLLGVNLGQSVPPDSVHKDILSAFNTALVPLAWREIEAKEGKRDWTLYDRQIDWCRARSLKICGGPLLEFDKHALPDWLYLWDGDYENLSGFVRAHIQAVVTHYRGKVNLWQCASRMNVYDLLGLSEEQRLRLTVLAVEATRQADPRAPVLLSIDQPWAEFMGREECDLSPLHFADALVRADLGLAGLGLEINMGYAPGTSPRDLLDFSRQIDRWTSLGLPLLLTLTTPSGAGADEKARGPARPISFLPDGPSLESQAEWLHRLLPLLLGKQPVQAVIWNQLLDSQPHDFPHSGLFDSQDQPKPALAAFQNAKRRVG